MPETKYTLKRIIVGLFKRLAYLLFFLSWGLFIIVAFNGFWMEREYGKYIEELRAVNPDLASRPEIGKMPAIMFEWSCIWSREQRRFFHLPFALGWRCPKAGCKPRMQYYAAYLYYSAKERDSIVKSHQWMLRLRNDPELGD